MGGGSVGSSVAGRGRRGTKWLGLGLAAVLSTAGLAAVAGTGVASAASPHTLDLKVLLIGNGSIRSHDRGLGRGADQ